MRIGEQCSTYVFYHNLSNQFQYRKKSEMVKDLAKEYLWCPLQEAVASDLW